MAGVVHLPRALFSLAHTRSRIDDVNSQIADLKHAINQLKLERKILQNHLDSYVYPVLALPNEIVSEIFLHTLDSSGTLAGGLGRNSPIFLSHVCRQWRDIALSTPALWAQLHLFVVRRSDARTETCLRLLDLWLSRSRECPLSIYMVKYTFPPLSPRFLDALAPHLRRCCDLRLHIPSGAIPSISGKVPWLRTLSISSSDSILEDSQPSWPLTMFSHAPQLGELSLESINFHMLQFPWRQITSLTLTQLDRLHDLTKILGAAVNLTSLAVETVHPANVHPAPPAAPLPPLGRLQALVLKGSKLMLNNQLLDMLTLPAVNRITTPQLCLSATKRLLARSQCSLVGLRIFCPPHDEYCATFSPTGVISLQSVESSDDSDWEEGRTSHGFLV
ncbi:hypothetical protein C8R43DRAFT_1017077 [Mycena crocata]|nr:hypothetical protein C8R43DRAFT_1017077 [Mycena crocata]